MPRGGAPHQHGDMSSVDGLPPPAPIVLCGVDATEGAHTVVAAAKATAARMDAPLLLAHVVRSTWDARVPAFKAEQEIPRVATYGPAGPRLLAEAEHRGAELIVVGTRALGRVRGVLYGSVSRHLARRARCPVMIVPPGADPEAPGTGSHVVCTLREGQDAHVLDHATTLARRLGTSLVLVHARSQRDPVAAVLAASERAVAVVVGAPGRWGREEPSSHILARAGIVPLILVPRPA